MSILMFSQIKALNLSIEIIHISVREYSNLNIRGVWSQAKNVDFVVLNFTFKGLFNKKKK